MKRLLFFVFFMFEIAFVLAQPGIKVASISTIDTISVYSTNAVTFVLNNNDSTDAYLELIQYGHPTFIIYDGNDTIRISPYFTGLERKVLLQGLKPFTQDTVRCIADMLYLFTEYLSYRISEQEISSLHFDTLKVRVASFIDTAKRCQISWGGKISNEFMLAAFPNLELSSISFLLQKAVVVGRINPNYDRSRLHLSSSQGEWGLGISPAFVTEFLNSHSISVFAFHVELDQVLCKSMSLISNPITDPYMEIGKYLNNTKQELIAFKFRYYEPWQLIIINDHIEQIDELLPIFQD